MSMRMGRRMRRKMKIAHEELRELLVSSNDARSLPSFEGLLLHVDLPALMDNVAPKVEGKFGKEG